jgi:hypothetical protein
MGMERGKDGKENKRKCIVERKTATVTADGVSTRKYKLAVNLVPTFLVHHPPLLAITMSAVTAPTPQHSLPVPPAVQAPAQDGRPANPLKDCT